MNSRIQAGIVLIVVTAAVAAVGFWLRGLQSNTHPVPAPSLEDAPTPMLSIAPSPVASVLRGGEGAGEAFRERFGASLVFERAADGSLIAIRGALGKGAKAEAGFRTDDVTLVRARALEILSAAGELIGLNSELPSGDPLTRTGPVSAQVYFHETWRGIALEPLGSVSVDLGPQGELLNLSSNYVSDVRVSGERRVSSSDARKQAEASVATSALPTSGGRPIVWVSRGPLGQPVQGRQAFDFDVGGRQVVVDAENGKILSSRDRRQY